MACNYALANMDLNFFEEEMRALESQIKDANCLSHFAADLGLEANRERNGPGSSSLTPKGPCLTCTWTLLIICEQHLPAPEFEMGAMQRCAIP